MYREEHLTALLEGRRILIAGYGREGQSAERLIKRLVPEAHYTIAVQVESGKWKAESGEWHEDWPFDMVIKSPGIPNFQFPILTSSTHLGFEKANAFAFCSSFAAPNFQFLTPSSRMRVSSCCDMSGH